MSLPTEKDYMAFFSMKELRPILQRRGLPVLEDDRQERVVQVAMEWDRNNPSIAVETYRAALKAAAPMKVERLRMAKENKGSRSKKTKAKGEPRKRPVGLPASTGQQEKDEERSDVDNQGIDGGSEEEEPFGVNNQSMNGGFGNEEVPEMNEDNIKDKQQVDLGYEVDEDSININGDSEDDETSVMDEDSDNGEPDGVQQQLSREQRGHEYMEPGGSSISYQSMSGMPSFPYHDGLQIPGNENLSSGLLESFNNQASTFEDPNDRTFSSGRAYSMSGPRSSFFQRNNNGTHFMSNLAPTGLSNQEAQQPHWRNNPRPVSGNETVDTELVNTHPMAATILQHFQQPVPAWLKSCMVKTQGALNVATAIPGSANLNMIRSELEGLQSVASMYQQLSQHSFDGDGALGEVNLWDG